MRNFQGMIFKMDPNIQGDFQIYISVTLSIAKNFQDSYFQMFESSK